MRPLLALALLAAGCNTGFDPQYRVTDLRILAVKAEVVGGTDPFLADVAPGDSVELKALVAHPRNPAEPLVRWFLCLPTNINDVPPCLDPEYLKDPAGLAAVYGVPQIAAGSNPAPIPVVASDPRIAGVTAAAIDLALDEPTFQCRLYVEVPIVVVAEQDGRREVAVKRVRLKPTDAQIDEHPELAGAYVVNHNPRVLDLVRASVGDETCASPTPVVASATDPFPAGRLTICGHGDRQEDFNVCGPAGERTSTHETLSFQWYVTGGEFPEFDGRGNATGVSVEFERPAGAFTLWTIVRDGRGGEGWTELHLQ